VVEGDFGVRTSTFHESDSFEIVENEASRKGNMAEIWADLSENKTYHVLLTAYKNQNRFDLARIYMD
jgi:hypothetical protein